MQTGRFLRRAALRGGLAAGVSALPALFAGGGSRDRRRAAAVRAAVVGAGVVGAGVELPAVAAPLAVAGLVALKRSGAMQRGALAGTALRVTAGAATALGTKRFWPVAPRTAAQVRQPLTRLEHLSSPDGDGLAIVVNPSSGPAFRRPAADELKQAFPKADVIELAEGDDASEVLEKAASNARVLGVAGGDGTVSAAAAVAHREDKALAVFPSGTLNHLARDLGLGSIDDGVRAVREGHTGAIDVAAIDDHLFVNTASFGSYAQLVDMRERLEPTIGKWPAMFVSLARVLRHSKPVRVEINEKPREIWMIFIGNCCYHPAGFAPSWRERLDDGLLDVRLVDASHPYARLRLLAAVLTGRLGRCRAYEAFTATSIRVRSLHGALRLAHDGETFDGSEEFDIVKLDRPLGSFCRK